MRFSRQGYWSGLSFPSPGDLPNPGIKPRSLILQENSLPTELQVKWSEVTQLCPTLCDLMDCSPSYSPDLVPVVCCLMTTFLCEWYFKAGLCKSFITKPRDSVPWQDSNASSKVVCNHQKLWAVMSIKSCLINHPGEGDGDPLQYPCLENLMDRGAWWATVHGVTKSRAQLSN